MLRLVPLKGSKGTNHEGLFIDANSPTGRILRRTAPTMAFDEAPDLKPTTSTDDDADRERLKALLKNMSAEDIAGLINEVAPDKVQDIWSALTSNSSDDDVSEDDETDGVKENATNKERNALGIDKRIAADKAIKNEKGFSSRWGDRIKVDNWGVK